MANRNWLRTASMEDVQRYQDNYQKQLMLEAQRRRVNDQLDLFNFPKTSDDPTRCQKDWVIPLVCEHSEYFHSESFHGDSFHSETSTARSPKITTTISTTFTTPTLTTGIYLTEAENERIPYVVIILGSIAIVFSIFILAMILFLKFKRTKKQPSTSETEIESQFETTSMATNPEISESTESITETSSLADLWKRIKEDDNYQPINAPSTSAPLAAVLQTHS